MKKQIKNIQIANNPKFSNSVIQKFSNSFPAFTLIELLVVITIIGILITLVTVAVVPVQRKSRDARRKADVNSFLSGVNLFKADFKIYPNSTFYLGSYGTVANGGANSNYAVASDIANNCNNATVGATSTFLFIPTGESIATTGKPTTTEMDTKPLLMKPGFVSVNNFLICLRYTDRLLADPKPISTSAWDKYQYRVSYDYGDAVVTSRLENGTTDSDASHLFNQTGSVPKRYNRGSGVVVRHLDDDSDSYLGIDTYTSNFFTALGSGNRNDGKYLYQCLKKDATTDISRDNRVSIEPIITISNSWSANNTQCYNNAAGLDVVAAY